MTGADTLITLPVNDPTKAKKRLSGVLDAEARAELMMMLLTRNLRVITRTAPTVPVLVITPSERVAIAARQYGAHVLMETAPGGLNRAVGTATSWALLKGVSRHLVLHADIALLDRAELQDLLSLRMTPPAVALCPAEDDGTNAMMMCPPGVLAPCYGQGSASAHLAAARKRGIATTVLKLNNMAFDIDTPEDLSRFIASGVMDREVEGEDDQGIEIIRQAG